MASLEESKNNTTGDTEYSYSLALICLTLPMWTLIIIYTLLIIIHYVRRVQYYYLYDRCNPSNAHFRYDFNIAIGKHSVNFLKYEALLIIDLLDAQLISSLTIQIPGTTIFNDQLIFMHNHCRKNLRYVRFTIYRRAPIKDVKSVRIAHSCSSQDSRIFVYGINLYDRINGENKFFPISSLVKYRGTQWALNTSFEPKNDLNFKKIGCDCVDPYGVSPWPSYVEIVTIMTFIWCACLSLGYLVPVKLLSNNIPLHSISLAFIVAAMASLISAAHLFGIKRHIDDHHYETFYWYLLKIFMVLLVNIISFSIWIIAFRQLDIGDMGTKKWAWSCLIAASVLCILTIAIYLMARKRKSSLDETLLNNQDAVLMKTNSKPNMEFTNDLTLGANHRVPTNSNTKRSDTIKMDEKQTVTHALNRQQSKKKDKKNVVKDPTPEDNLDNVFAATQNSRYMKTKNRNSISQYV